MKNFFQWRVKATPDKVKMVERDEEEKNAANPKTITHESEISFDGQENGENESNVQQKVKMVEAQMKTVEREKVSNETVK